MRCLVTGGTGFIGSNLALYLLEEGHEVLITGHEAEQQLPGFQGKCLYPGLTGIDWEAVGHIDALFHQAAINNTRMMDRREMLRANVESSRALFEYVLARGCRKIVYASSTAVYGRNPAPYKETDDFDLNTPYAESKKLLEDAAGELNEKYPDATFVGLRYCNVYGPREYHKGSRATMIYQFAQQMQKGNPKLFKFGEQLRDYIYVKDVVHANILAASSQESCIVNCGSGQSTSFNRLVEILNDILGVSRIPEYIDNPYESSYQNHTECDMSLAREKIGFAPEYSIDKGIHDYFESGFLFKSR